MARRRKSLIDDLFAIATTLPWWLNLVLAFLFYVGLGMAADLERPQPTGLEDLSTSIAAQFLHTFAALGQIAFPVLFVIAAGASALKRWHGGRLVDEYRRAAQSSSMTWQNFEALVEEIFRRRGYSVTKTPNGADGGVDLLATRDGAKLLIQCKHWQSRQVGVRVVRELMGVVVADGAQGGAVVTSGSFTPDAVKFAKQAGIELFDGVALQELAHAPRPTDIPPDRPAGDGDSHTPACPTCGSVMVLRTARRGRNAGQQFWGCSRYPGCKGTVSAGVKPAPQC